MVPGQLSLSEREQNQRADCGLQKETPAALHSSYDQWDPCGESKQLQVPRRKHLRGPDLDYTHPNTGQESQAKTVPSATAEKIQGLTNNPENFLCRDHRKCFVSVHLSVVWKQLQPRLQSLAESCALSWAYLWVGSPLSAGQLHQTMQRQSWQNHQRLNHPGNCLFTRLPSGKRFRCLMAKTERLRRSFFPTAIRLLNSKSAS